MMFEEILTFIYLSGSVMIGISYLPQIHKLLTCRTRAESFSISTVSIWFYVGAASAFYALFINKDIYLILTTAVNCLGCLSLLVLVLFNRFAKPRITGREDISIMDMIKKRLPDIQIVETAAQPIPVKTEQEYPTSKW